MNNRKLINYLPPFMQDYQELKSIMETEQVEVDRLWVEANNALADQFIMDATENGVKRWESILSISPKDTETVNERKFRILTKMNQELPYTLTKLKEALTTLCGADGFSINLQSANYHIEVKLAVDNQNNYQEVVNLLTKMIPANMTQTVQVLYNPHTVFTSMKHTQLASYTHDQLRKEVFE